MKERRTILQILLREAKAHPLFAILPMAIIITTILGLIQIIWLG